MTRIVFCSKSTWDPPVRREHALAQAAAADGHEVVFLERPSDARALKHPSGWGAWRRGLRAAQALAPQPGIEVRAQSALAPGHRGALAQALETRRLQRVLEQVAGAEAVVVATLPWQWPAVAAAPAGRRVYDGGDDWRALLPRRARRIEALHARIGAEAGAIVVASEQLAHAFGPRAAAVVPNATGPELLDTAPAPPPSEHHLVYAGTLSERLDLALLGAALDRLDGWTLELVGQCQYPGRGEKPSGELRSFLAKRGEQVVWRGPVERSQLPEALDRAAVLLIPHSPGPDRGQDPMKVYDYAARGRPIVASEHVGGVLEAGARIRVAEGADAFAAAILDAAAEDDEPRNARREWAETQTWTVRWPAWSAEAIGALA